MAKLPWGNLLEAREFLLDRYPRLREGANDLRIVDAVAGLSKKCEWRDVAVRWADAVSGEEYPPASGDDALAALAMLTYERKRLEWDELHLIDVARREGKTWPEIAAALNVLTAQGAQQRRARLFKTGVGGMLRWALDPDRAGSAMPPDEAP